MKHKIVILSLSMIFILILILFINLTDFEIQENNKPMLRGIPEKEKFIEIANEPYVMDINDCSNKAAKYFRILKEKGYDASIILIRSKELYHALVKINYGGNYYYADPTWGMFFSEDSYDSVFKESYMGATEQFSIDEKKLLYGWVEFEEFVGVEE